MEDKRGNTHGNIWRITKRKIRPENKSPPHNPLFKQSRFVWPVLPALSDMSALKCASKMELDDTQRDGRKIIADCMEQGFFISCRNHSSWADSQNNVDPTDDTLRIRAGMRTKEELTQPQHEMWYIPTVSVSHFCSRCFFTSFFCYTIWLNLLFVLCLLRWIYSI